jgi:cytochrome c
MAAADPAMGQRQYIVCQACHSVDAGGAHKVGPNLHGIFGRAAGQAEGFMYSSALRDSGITWDAATMDEWLAGPSMMVPGTIMVFAGVNDPVQRANLIAYLQQVTGASN